VIPTKDQVDRGQGDVNGGPCSDVGAGDEGRRRIESPKARPSADVDGFAHERPDRAVGHPLEHRPVRVGVGRQERTIEPLGLELGPGDFEEADETRIVDVGDRRDAVIGRGDRREPAVGLECRADQLGAFGDLVRGHRHPHERLDRDVVAQMCRRVDHLHPDPAL
jgi:hypothetical protein